MPGKWHFTETQIGVQPIQTTETTQALPLGTIRRGMWSGQDAVSANYGAGEFIYLRGAANTLVGSLVTFDPQNGTTTLAPNTANLNAPLAVAMSANLANQFGWYQIAGVALIRKTGVPVAAGVNVFLSATAGRVRATAASGRQIVNARTVNTASVAAGTSVVPVLIQRPHAQGQVI